MAPTEQVVVAEEKPSLPESAEVVPVLKPQAETIAPQISADAVAGFDLLNFAAMLLSAAWLSGALYFLLLSLASFRKQWTILQGAIPANEPLAKLVNQVARQVGLRKLSTLVSSSVLSPFISCAGRVRMLWPEKLAKVESANVRALVAHEAAHVVRLDHWVARLELVASWVWWWNPLFWLVRRQLRCTADMACDALALETYPEDRCVYAEKLFELSTFGSGTSPLVLSASGGSISSIERRMAMIVSDRVSGRVTLSGFLLTILLGMCVLPSWTVAQGTGGGEPPFPKVIDQELAADDIAKSSPKSQQEKVLLRLKAMYLVAMAEDRTADAEALSAAIVAMSKESTAATRDVTKSDATVLDWRVDTAQERPSAFGERMRARFEESMRGRSTARGGAGGGMMGELGGASGVAGELGFPGFGGSGIGGMYGNRVANAITLTNLRSYQGLALRVKVEGADDGPVWGSNSYTDDSSINAAALHAGLVKLVKRVKSLQLSNQGWKIIPEARHMVLLHLTTQSIREVTSSYQSSKIRTLRTYVVEVPCLAMTTHIYRST